MTEATVSQACGCIQAPSGLNAICPSKSFHKQQYDVCRSTDEGYSECHDELKEIGWQADCTMSYNWNRISTCLNAGSATCLVACVPFIETLLGYLACATACSSSVVALGGCAGCDIRNCNLSARTPLYAMKAISLDGYGCSKEPDRAKPKKINKLSLINNCSLVPISLN
jgi:hypothetical protein